MRLLLAVMTFLMFCLTNASGTHHLHVKPGADTFFYDGEPMFAVSNRWGSEYFEAFVNKAGGNFRNREYIALCQRLQKDLSFAEDAVREMDNIVLPCLERDVPVRISLSHAHGDIPVPVAAAEALDLPRPKRLSNVGPAFTFLRPEARDLAFKEARFKAERYRGKDVMYMIGVETDRVFLNNEVHEYRKSNILNEWAKWLRSDEFDGDITALQGYLGIEADTFDGVPYPRGLDYSDERFGFPARAIELKQRFLFDRWCWFLNRERAIIKEIAPQALTSHKLTTHFTAEHAAQSPVEAYLVSGRYFGDMVREPVYMKPWYGVYYTLYPAPGPRVAKMGIFDPTNPHRPHGSCTKPNGPQLRNIFYTDIANGASAFEAWLENRAPDGMFEPVPEGQHLTPYGANAAKLFHHGKYLAPYLVRHVRDPQVAVYSNEFSTLKSYHLEQHNLMSKVGVWGAVRELGYDFNALPRSAIINGAVSQYKALILAGDVSLHPQVQDAIRDYVRDGGTLVCSYDGRAAAFPGANSYDYGGSPLDSVEKASFTEPPSVAHLGDVMGVNSGGGSGGLRTVKFNQTFGNIQAGETISPESVRQARDGFKHQLAEADGRQLSVDLACAHLRPTPDAGIIATFAEDEAVVPAIIRHELGDGRVYTIGYNLGAVATFSYSPLAFDVLEHILTNAGCERDISTDNHRVECGCWEDNRCRRTIFLVNHNDAEAETGTLHITADQGRYAIVGGDNQIDTAAGVTTHEFQLEPYCASVIQTVATVQPQSNLKVEATEKAESLELTMTGTHRQDIAVAIIRRPEANISDITVNGDRVSFEDAGDGLTQLQLTLPADEPVTVIAHGQIVEPYQPPTEYLPHTVTAQTTMESPDAEAGTITAALHVENQGMKPVDVSWRIAKLPEGYECKTAGDDMGLLRPQQSKQVQLEFESRMERVCIGTAVVEVTTSVGQHRTTRSCTVMLRNAIDYALICRGAKATASGYLQAEQAPWLSEDSPPKEAIDGIISREVQNRWHSELRGKAPWWLHIRLPEERTITAAAIYPPKNVYLRGVSNYIRDFKLQYSEDGGETWITIFTENDFTGRDYFRTFEAVRGKHFRLLITESRNRKYTQIGEIELYGSSKG